MRVAAIDLGTNTFHMLVSELRDGGDCVHVYRARYRVLLGQEGMRAGFISKPAQTRALSAARDLRALIETWRPDHVWAVATSACRQAKNGLELVAEMGRLLNVEIAILSGKEEATLIGEGIQWAVAHSGLNRYLGMDIGGGSVEFIVVAENKKSLFYSFEIGAQRLYDAFHKTDPMLSAEKQRLHAHLTILLRPLFGALKEYAPTCLVGSSGTFNTLYDIYAAAEGAPRRRKENPLYTMPIANSRQIYELLIQKNYAERLRIPGMAEARAHLIPFGAALVKCLIEGYAFAQLCVSNYALKEGLIAHHLQKEGISLIR